MPFFIRGHKKVANKSKQTKPSKQKKDGDGKNSDATFGRKRKLKESDGEITSESEIESDNEGSEAVNKKVNVESSSEDENETVAEKRLRLAKEILEKIKEEETRKLEDEEERDVVADRLKKDILEQSGKLRKQVAQLCVAPSLEDVKVCRWRKLSCVTCVAISPDDQHVYCGTKDGSIIKWSVKDGSKVGHIPAAERTEKSGQGLSQTGQGHAGQGHIGHVLCIAVSSNNKYLISGGRDKLIHVWNPDTLTFIHTFQGHKAAVTGVTVRRGGEELFSVSEDRSVKVWNLAEMGYVETLFGHEVGVTGVDCLAQERVLTSGGRDGSVRLWKIIDESHLIFHGHSSSIDCVCYINDQNFLSGSEDGSLALWGTMKKKPLYLLRNAHTVIGQSNHVTNGDSQSEIESNNQNQSGCWISCVAALPYTDLVVSGSSDGLIRFWDCGHDCRSLKPLFSLPVEGYVNSLRFSSDGRFLVAGVGREHRLGRWSPIKHVKDSLLIIKLNRTELDQQLPARSMQQRKQLNTAKSLNNSQQLSINNSMQFRPVTNQNKLNKQVNLKNKKLGQNNVKQKSKK